jgi:protease II
MIVCVTNKLEKKKKYVTINANSLSSSEVRVIESNHDYKDKSLPTIQLVKPRVHGLEYYVDHHEVKLLHPTKLCAYIILISYF